MTEWIREGLEGRGFRATLRLYIFGLIVLAPFAALVGFLSDTSTVFRVTPLLAGILVGVQYVVSYYAKLRGADTKAPDKVPNSMKSGALSENDNRDLSSELHRELARLLPQNLLNLPYSEATRSYSQAFDRVYLRRLLDRHRQNVTAAAIAAGLDRQTFRERWKNAGLPPLSAGEEQADG